METRAEKRRKKKSFQQKWKHIFFLSTKLHNYISVSVCEFEDKNVRKKITS